MDIDFDVKAPLCGIEMMRYANPTSPAKALYRLRLISFDTLTFINVTNIGKSVEKEMSEYTKNSIINLINARKNIKSQWPMVIGIIGGVTTLIFLAVAAVFGVKKYRQGNQYSQLE